MRLMAALFVVAGIAMILYVIPFEARLFLGAILLILIGAEVWQNS
jgi:hypothetical protein